MPESLPVTASTSSYLLLGHFADFYQEIASIKGALAAGHLADYLAPDNSDPPRQASDYAGRVSARLLELLRLQDQQMRRSATMSELRAYRVACYLMAALADEIFILELDWPGRDAWLNVLLEQRIFQSSTSGQRFYSLAQQLIQTHRRSDLYTDLAAVFLLALELGFKGQYRGRSGQVPLLQLRQQLYSLVKPTPLARTDLFGEVVPEPAFPNAYAHVLLHGGDERLAPHGPWLRFGAWVLLAYALVSFFVWLILMQPFEQFMSGQIL